MEIMTLYLHFMTKELSNQNTPDSTTRAAFSRYLPPDPVTLDWGDGFAKWFMVHGFKVEGAER